MINKLIILFNFLTNKFILFHLIKYNTEYLKQIQFTKTRILNK